MMRRIISVVEDTGLWALSQQLQQISTQPSSKTFRKSPLKILLSFAMDAIEGIFSISVLTLVDGNQQLCTGTLLTS